MGKQIVLSGNRVIAHGTDCFLTIGETVICTNTGRVFVNATVAEVESVPDNVDAVGYEYHAGEFVPCAPFGVGDGNVPVLCGDDCKAIKDSGFAMAHVRQMGKMDAIEYVGTGTRSVSLSLPFIADLIIIMSAGSGTADYRACAIIGKEIGASWSMSYNENTVSNGYLLTADLSTETATWSAPNLNIDTARFSCNKSGIRYTAYVFGKVRE